MAAPCQSYSESHSQCHLRRISSQTAVSGVADVLHFWKTVTLIGRKKDVVDYFLSCATPGERNYMSRIHARVIWTSTYELVDSSLTGVYVNDIRIHGRVTLQEGDTVTFGHPAWQSVSPGARARQPNSPFYFLFEHCHCSTDQRQHLHGKSPVLAAAGASPEAGLSSGLKAAFPPRAQPRGCRRPAAFPALTPRLTGSPGTSSPFKDSVTWASRWSETPHDPQLGASPRSALGGPVQSPSRIRRSLSPEYAVPEEEVAVTREASSQGTIRGPFIQERPGRKGSEPAGGRSEEHPVGRMTGSSRGLSQPESCSSEARVSESRAIRPDGLPASPCPEDSAAAGLGGSSPGTQGSPAERPQDVQPLARSVQTKDLGGEPLEEGLPSSRSEASPEGMQEESAGDAAPEIHLSPPGTKDQVSSGSDHSQEIVQMETDESAEETTHSDTCCFAEPGVHRRVMEWMEEGVSDGQVTSAGCSQDRRMGEEGTWEGHDELFVEMPLLEAAFQETEWEADGSVTEDSLADEAENIAAETSDSLSASSGSKTPDDLLCEQEPDGVSPARPLTAERASSRDLTAAWPGKIQIGREACEPDSQEDASDREDDAETFPYVNTRLSATDCHLGPGDGGSGDPESGIAEDARFGELSCAEAGTQGGGRRAKETGPATAEPGAERGILEVLQHREGRLNTPVAKDALQQPLAEASASGFLTQEASPKGEFPEEKIITAAASSDGRQENSPPDSLLETCKEDAALAAATSPAGMVWGKGTLFEADLLEEPMDLGDKHLEERLAQKSEAFPEAMQEESAGGVAAERDLQHESPGLAGPDAGPEGQRVAYRLGCEQQDGGACAPLAASGAGGPDTLRGQESEGGEEAGQEGASGREESEGGSVATAFHVGAALEEGGLENQPERSCSSAGSSPAGDLGEEGPRPASPLARGHAGLPPPFPPPGAALEGGGSPRSGGGSGLSFQRSGKDAGSGSEAENGHLLPKRGDSEDADLSDDVLAMTQACAVATEDLADAWWHDEMAETNDGAQEERRADRAPFSGPSPRTEGLGASPPFQEWREPEWQGGEPHGLAGKPQRDDLAKVSLSPDEPPVDGGAWEDICGPGGGVGCPTPPVPEGCSEDVLLPEQGPLCCKNSQGLCAARTLPESTARNLHGENQTGSAVVPESSSSDELNSEAEREESDNGEAVIPKERDTLISDSAEHLDGVNENHKACSEVTEQRTTQGLCEAASQDAGGDPSEDADMLQEQSPLYSQPCCDVSGAAVAVQTDVAMGEKSPSSAKAAGLGAELEGRAVEGTALVPLSLLHALEKDSCLLESDAKLSGEDQAPGGPAGPAEEAGLDLPEGGGMLDGGLAGQPGLGTLEISGTPEENLQSEIPTGVHAEGVEGAPKMEGGEVLLPEQGPLCCRNSQGLCAARTLPESTARNLHGENQMGSAVVPESSSSDELNSEAERGENDNGEAVIPKERDTLISDSAELLDGVNENREPCSEVTEQCTKGPCEAARQDAGGDPSEAVDMLQEQSSLCSQPCCDVSGAAVAVQTDVAMGEKSSSSAGLGEELEDQAVEGTTLVPLSLLHAPEKDSCLLESDAKLGGEDQAPGGPAGPAEEAGLDLPEGGGMLDGGLAGHPGSGTLEISGTPEENLQSEIPTSVPAEGSEGAPKTEGEALLFLKQETEMQNSQEDESPSEDGPGCSDRLGSSEYGGIPSTKEEASEGCSSRKRPFGEGQVPGTQQSGNDSSSKKRLRLLHSGPDLQSPTKKLPTPLDLERRREQFDRTVGKFLQQCSSQATLHSGDAEGKNRDIIAEIVRTYFTSALALEEPVAESLKAEMSAQPLEAGISEGADCKPAAGSEPEKSAAGKESGSSPARNAEPQAPAPHGRRSPASTPSKPPGSQTQQPGRGVTGQVPESACKTYLSEEEEFQASISSLLQRDSLMENVLSPKATCVQESRGKNMDVVFSDIASSSVASVQGEPPSPSPDSKRSTGIRSGMLSEAAERDLCFPKREAAERDLCFPKPSDLGWCAEDTSASPTTCVSPHKGTQPPKGTFLAGLDAVGDHADAPVLQPADGTFDGEDGRMSPSAGASQWVTSCLMSSVGETREELDDDSTSRMQTEDGALLRRSHGDSPSQGDAWPRAAGSAQHASVCRGDGAESELWRPWASSEQDVAFQLQECQLVLEEISQSLCAVEGIDDMHMEKWREQIAELQKATKMPKTSIAVVGNTGAGKSSLLNALLEEEAVLPTSAMRACTAVVVEVSRAAGSYPFEADVEFLSREEWFKELDALLEDMKDKSGNLKKRCPDPKTEAGAAYSRVKAVYGRVDKASILEAQQDVTQHLGTVKNISAETASDFCAAIEKFISSRTDNLRDMKGGEFWPIVKCVKIRVAKAEVLKTGVVLVDLPGVRDSNAARDNAAKEYLKSCDAVWVVASITRAVDDKTAKEILNNNLRRQLFMDGQYGNLAFICTKTDSFNITDIVRDLDLRAEIQPLEEELEELEAQRMQAEEEKGSLHLALLQPELQRQGADAKDPAWLQRQHDFLEKEFRISSLQKQKDAKLRAISLVCVQARNRFSKQRIRMDFNAGLEELKRKAELSECDNDGDEDMEDGDLACSDAGDPGEAESQQEKLHVFTVSSTEYLKLSGKLLRDGPAQVFHDPKDTEIPALKNFAIETALKNSMKATEKVIRDVARIISNTVNYLTSQQAADISHQAYVQEVMQQSLQDVPRLLQEAVDDVLHDVQYYFGVLIKTSLQRGSNKVKGMCEDMVKSWGLPVYGLPHATYHAACRRHGAYSSPRYRSVDFNEELAKPIYEAVSTAWNEVFSSKVEESFNHFTKSILDKLKTFFRDLRGKLRQQSSVAEALQALHLQQMEAVQARLCNFLLDQEEQIGKRQRTISRLLSPSIQARMEPVYAACRQMSGRGYFQRMKNEMESYVRNNKDSIFDSATEKLQRQLELLQNYIRWNFQSLVDELCRSLRMQFEPLLKPVQRNAKIIPDLMNICAKVDKICKRSCVDYVLPSTPQAEASSPETGQALQGNSPCFSALCTDTDLGAGPLPHVASIQQQPTNDAEKLLDVPADPSWLPRVITVVQQPSLVPVNLQPYGGKRVGEALQPMPEKRRKSQAGGVQEAGPDPPPGWSMEGKVVPCGPSDVPCRLHASRECVPENCRWERDQLLGAAQLSFQMPASELNVVTGPGSTGAPTQAEEEKWGKRQDQRGP